ncbi:MAG TPA: ankyrin repeat domain-containing protein [Pyrinomonadaceae bacterium]|nr:ankyrin repeat domain-containing protein [Pyrinomonadaceae bacterium]
MTPDPQKTAPQSAARNPAPHVAGAQALARAAGAGDRDGVESLLAAGAFADAPLPNGETALMRAAARGFEDVARLLLDAGANPSARRADGFTPLTLAVFFGHEALVRLLLERGADTSAATRLGTTAAAWADARGFSEISALIAAAAAPRRRPAAPQQRTSHQVSGHAADAEPARQPTPPRQPVAGVLLAALAPDVRTGHDREGHGRASESELRARASEVSEVFGDRQGGAGATESTAEFTIGPAPEPAPEPAPGTAAAATGGGTLGAELFATAQSARPARAARSWQRTAGLFLLLVACTVAVYAAWRATGPGTQGGRQTINQPQAGGVQPVSPLPAPQPSAPQPTPGMTPFDSQSLAPGAAVPGEFVPYPAGEPVALPPVTPYAGGGTTSNPALVTEEARPPAGASRREGADAARDGRGAGEAAAGENSRGGAAAREPDSRADAPQQTVAPPVVAAPVPRPAPTASEPQPTPTPGRKVIQWPPS